MVEMITYDPEVYNETWNKISNVTMKKYRVETHILDELTKGDEITEGKYLDFIENYGCPESWFTPVEEEVKEGQYWEDQKGSVLRIDRVYDNGADCTFISDDSTGFKTLDFITDIGKLLDNDAVEEHLIAEAKRRGFKKSVTIQRPSTYMGYRGSDTIKMFRPCYKPDYDRLEIDGITAYESGEWASIVDEPIQINGKTITFDGTHFNISCGDSIPKRQFLEFWDIVDTYHLVVYHGGEDITDKIHQLAEKT